MGNALTSSLFGAISFDPNIRGILVMVVAVSVLCGSIYAIIATNTGVRQGFLIAAAGFFGWCFLMGLVWWIYGIGFKGKDPSWMGQEVNLGGESIHNDDLRQLPLDKLPAPVDLLDKYPEVKAEAMKDPAFASLVNDFGGSRLTLTKVVTLDKEIRDDVDAMLGEWRIIPESDARRGETVAASDAVLTSASGKSATGFTAPADYFVEDVFFLGGKAAGEPYLAGEDPGPITRAKNRIETTLQVKNPKLYAAVTLRAVKKFPVDVSKAPPPPQPDEQSKPAAVFMLRNLGNKRLWPAVFALTNGALFALFCFLLHARDRRFTHMQAELTARSGAG